MSENENTNQDKQNLPEPEGAPLDPFGQQGGAQQAPGNQQGQSAQTPDAPQQNTAPQQPENGQAQQSAPVNSTQQQPQQGSQQSNGSSFFGLSPEGEEDPGPMSGGVKASWFILGLFGGMFGLLWAWISTTMFARSYRRQAMLLTWIGFACQAVLFLIYTLSSGPSPLFSDGTTAVQSTGTSGTSSSSAFG
jgi:hypothetical protein